MAIQLIDFTVVAQTTNATPGFPYGGGLIPGGTAQIAIPADADNFFVRDAALFKAAALPGIAPATLATIKSQVLLYTWNANDVEPAAMSLWCTNDPADFDTMFEAQGLVIPIKAVVAPATATIFATAVTYCFPTRFTQYFVTPVTTQPTIIVNGKPVTLTGMQAQVGWWKFGAAPVTFYTANTYASIIAQANA